MAPQTIDMQSPSNEYFKTALNIKDILTVVNMQYYNSGSMNGCDGKVYSQGTVDFLTALACIQLQGGLDPSQVGLGVPASTSGAGSGYVVPVRRERGPGLPDQGHELRLLQAVEDLPGPARRDDLVHQLGRHRRATPGPTRSGRTSTPCRNHRTYDTSAAPPVAREAPLRAACSVVPCPAGHGLGRAQPARLRSILLPAPMQGTMRYVSSA